MRKYIDAEALDRAFSKLRFNNDGELEHYGDRPNWYLWGSEVENLIADAPSIDLADYVPKDFHDKTCEAMAKAHQEEITDILERADVDRPQGEWIYTDNPLRLDDEWACSRCGNISFARTNFCDRCGARMKGTDDE